MLRSQDLAGNVVQREHRFSAVQRVLGILLMLFSLTMLPPMAVGLLADDGAWYCFGEGLWTSLATGALVWWPVRRADADLRLRDGFLVVVLFWVVLSVFGAIPLYTTHSGWNTFLDALFEAVSGLTTTGATVVPSGLDELPLSILYYRSQLQWLGGMGVIVLAVALLPMLGIGGMQMFRAETPGPMKDAKLTPRIAGTARALWYVYVTLTLACALAYAALGMSPFDAICHAMTTISTGGYSTHDASLGYFRNPPLEWAAIVFMLLGAFNFAVHFSVWRERNPLRYFRDIEIRACLAIVAGFTILIFVPVRLATDHGAPWFDDVREILFHVVSYGTTTGYGTVDPSLWPGYGPLMLMLCGFMVGCAGSTSGGVKVIRLLVFVRQSLREMQRLIHPNASMPIKLGGRIVPDPVVHAVGGFFSVYIGATIVLTFLMMTTGLDAVHAFSAVAASINNVGPALGELNASMATVSDFGKSVLIFSMLLGRLEIFTLLILFTPGFWRR